MAQLSDAVREKILAPIFWQFGTVNPDGSPQVTPVWLDAEGDRIVVNTAVGRLKERNARRDPRVTLAMFDPDNPYERIQIRGRVVEFIEGQRAEDSIDTLCKKYTGVHPYPWRQPGEHRIILLVEPTRVSHFVP